MEIEYKKALRNCSLGELNLLYKIIVKKHREEEKIINKIIRERRKNEKN